MKLNLRRTEIILILGFWLVGCALLGIVLLLSYQQQKIKRDVGTPEAIHVPLATYTVVHTQITAKSQQTVALEKVALWHDDAVLVSVASNWDKTNIDTVGQPSTWTYRYYSHGHKRLFFVTVTADGQATGISHIERIYNRPETIKATNWIDSSEAVNIWLNYGGAIMMRSFPDIQVVAQLKIISKGGTLEWTVAGFDDISKKYHTIYINAIDKKIIRIDSKLQ
ncbi:MAG: hypothetical protein B6242_03235 [Anaerolineaceae bacterium 4572_78]|nr:MAG: hypothetical protein B6242_03235 [Anaerolineaceae bacterium 4572_78]